MQLQIGTVSDVACVCVQQSLPRLAQQRYTHLEDEVEAVSNCTLIGLELLVRCKEDLAVDCYAKALGHHVKLTHGGVQAAAAAARVMQAYMRQSCVMLTASA
jgi:hypothetical protein